MRVMPGDGQQYYMRHHYNMCSVRHVEAVILLWSDSIWYVLGLLIHTSAKWTGNFISSHSRWWMMDGFCNWDTFDYVIVFSQSVRMRPNPWTCGHTSLSVLYTVSQFMQLAWSKLSSCCRPVFLSTGMQKKKLMAQEEQRIFFNWEKLFCTLQVISKYRISLCYLLQFYLPILFLL